MHSNIDGNKFKKLFFFLGIIFLALLYLGIAALCIQFVIFIKAVEGSLFWGITLIMNLLLSVFIKMKEDKYVLIRAFAASIVSNFFIVGSLLFLMTKPFRYGFNSSISDALNKYLSLLTEISFTGNWLLPVLFFAVKKAMSYRKEGNVPEMRVPPA